MNNSFIELTKRGGGGSKSRLVLPAGGAITIGSGVDCDIVIEHHDVAPCQARLLFDQEVVTLEPANAAGVRSTLLLDGEPITAPIAMQAGQEMAIGPAVLTWRYLPKEEWPTMPAARLEGRRGSAVVQLAEELKKGRYRAGSEVGRGGMGRILQAEEAPLRRPVAMKVLLTSEKGQLHAEERFIREARVTGGLQHPSIVPVHELNVDESGRVFYTMKLVKGMTLREVLHRLSNGEPEAGRSYRLSSLLTIFQKVCDAVAFAHAQPNPIIHRDLKPDNIMVGEYGEVLVMDWGLAKVLGRDDLPGDGNNDANGNELDDTLDVALLVTQPGAAMGTPGYMAPEQARGQAGTADERTDIYALGAILYALLTLESPVKITSKEAHDFQERWQEGEEVTHTFRGYVAPLLTDRSMRKKLDHLPGRTVPDSLVAVVLKAMALRWEDRFESVKKLQADVAAYQSGFATSAEEARAWRRLKLLVARNKTLFTAIVAIFLVLLAATTISLQQRQAVVESNKGLQVTLQQASQADLEAARQRFRVGAWREGVALLGRSLAFWPDNREAANYLLSAIVFGHGDGDRLPIFGVYHDAAIDEAVFSPAGQYFATASYDHTTCIWDAATGAKIGKTLHHDGPCCMPRFSPDGRQLLTTGEDGVAMLWDIGTGEPLGKPMRHGRRDLDSLSNVTSGVFSSDGKRILTGSLDHTARIWDAVSGKEIAQMVAPHRISDAVFSPDETRILAPYWYGGAMLWDAITFQPIGSPMTHTATVRKALFTPDGNKIVTASLDKTARIWDGNTGQPLSPPLSHTDAVWTLDVSPDGKLFATACYDKTVRLWSLADGSPVGVPMEHEGPVDTVAFSPDGKRLVSASRDKTVRLWDVATCKPLGTPMRHDETVLRALFNPDATKVLSMGWDSAAYLWDAAVPAWPGEILPVPGQVQSIEFAEDDDRVFISTRDGLAGLWSLSKKEFVTPVAHHPTAISAAVFHSSSKQFATAGPDGVIRFWSALSGKQIGETMAGNDTIVALSFSADGSSLFAAYLGGSVLQWKIPEGTQIGKVMKHPEKMDTLAVAPSGRELATGCRDDFLYFWETQSGNALPGKIRHGNPVLAISYHPDGRSIATGSDDHTARVWSLDSSQQLGEPFTLSGRATAVRYAAQGSVLLVGGNQDTEVYYYDTKTHNTLYLPLPHPTGVSQISSNATGSLVATVTNDGVARLWRIPFTSHSPPKWLPEYLRALGGLSFSAQQQLTQVSTRERLDLRKELLSHPLDDSIWDAVMRRSFRRTEPRAADPGSNAGR